MYSYLKFIVYDKLLKPRQSFWITLYKVPLFLYSNQYRQYPYYIRIILNRTTKRPEMLSNNLWFIKCLVKKLN
jgi:hypothetical protein